MERREFWLLEGVSDDDLLAGPNGLLGAGARVEARVVAHLAEVEARRLHFLAGCSSLYDYCRKRLGLSDYEAFTRIAVARVARKFPVVFGMLERRELHLTAICEVREFLTVENHRQLLAAVSGQTKLQIREVLAQRFPEADAAASLKRLPALEPLSPGRYRLQLTLSAEQKEKLELARDLLSHANASGDLAIVLERALDELISRLEQRRFGRTQPRPARQSAQAPASERAEAPVGQRAEGPTRQRAGGPARQHAEGPARQRAEGPARQRAEAPVATNGVAAPKGREGERRKHIAHETRREVWAPDGARCAFVADDGQRCDGRAFLQFHHRHAWARGGGDGADNLELLCCGHNRLLAERDFGRTHVDAAIVGRRVEGAERSLAGDAGPDG